MIQQHNIKQKRETNFDNKKHDNGGASKDQTKLKLKHNESLLFKPIRATNKILEGHVPQTTRGTQKEEQRIGTSTPTTKAVRDGRALPRELLDNGQGKCDVCPVMDEESGSDMDISAEGSAEAAPTTTTEGDGTARPLPPTRSGEHTKGLRKFWMPNQNWPGLDSQRNPGSNQSLEPEAIAHFAEEVADKVKKGQARVVLWDDIKHNHPRQLKVSPVAAIPHKSRAYRSILDLSFALRLEDGGCVQSVNDTTKKWAPRGAIDQLGHSLKRIIHAFAETEDDAVILMAKWDIQDGFWRLNCRDGEEWNFCYVWPQAPGEPTRLVVPDSLQMGWVESAPYFCTASETARDVAVDYIETKIGSLKQHKFDHWAGADNCPTNSGRPSAALRYFLEVYVDNFISCIVPTTKEQVEHVARAILHGIHDVFPPSTDDSKDPISTKKLNKGEGTFDTKSAYSGLTSTA